MIMLASKKVFFEYIYVIVERLLKENPKYLSSRNDSNEDALYLAAMVQKREPLIAGYIAESFIRGKQDVNKVKHPSVNSKCKIHCLGTFVAEVQQREHAAALFGPERRHSRQGHRKTAPA